MSASYLMLTTLKAMPLFIKPTVLVFTKNYQSHVNLKSELVSVFSERIPNLCVYFALNQLNRAHL
jgi:hypothetical protein